MRKSSSVKNGVQKTLPRRASRERTGKMMAPPSSLAPLAPLYPPLRGLFTDNRDHRFRNGNIWLDDSGPNLIAVTIKFNSFFSSSFPLRLRGSLSRLRANNPASYAGYKAITREFAVQFILFFGSWKITREIKFVRLRDFVLFMFILFTFYK